MVKARAEFVAKGEAYVGQCVTLAVELSVPGFFAGTPKFDLPSVPGVLIIPPEASPVLSTEEEEGVSYTVQRHEFSIFARRPGKHEIPPLTIRLQFKRNPLDQEAVAQTVRTSSISFTARQPPGAENLGAIISARDLKVEETWNPQTGKRKAGDAFTRTITFTSPDVPAMAFPEFPVAKIDGLGIYPKSPEVLDHAERGILLGERRDIITYVCGRPGHFTIPAARLTWFDLDSRQLQTINFPERIIEVGPNPALPMANASSGPSRMERRLVNVAGVLLLMGMTAILASRLPISRIWHRVIARWRPIHLQTLNPTHPAFHQPTGQAKR